MTRPRVALLNAAHNAADTTRNFRRELDADLVEFHATEGELPDHHDFDGCVVTGSRSSVYWDEAWIPPLLDYVETAHERGVPVLGVCFGHQVLAAALGGRVDDMGEYEIGYRDIEQTAEDPIFDGIGNTFTVFTTHSDAVVELPEGAQLLAENDYGIHAFRAGHSVGVQFHPEYDQQTAERVTKKKDDLDPDREAEVLAGIDAEKYAAACEAKQLFENFTQQVQEPRAAD